MAYYLTVKYNNNNIINKLDVSSGTTKILNTGNKLLSDAITIEVVSAIQTRYIKVRLNGSSANTSSHFVEVMAYDMNGTNVLAGKQPTIITGTQEDDHSTLVTDGITSTSNYWGFRGDTILWFDLGQLYQLKSIKRWNYYGDSRTYYYNETWISPDNTNWTCIFNSETDGRYVESSAGKEVIINS